jgi:hypothetical protein
MACASDIDFLGRVDVGGVDCGGVDFGGDDLAGLDFCDFDFGCFDFDGDLPELDTVPPSDRSPASLFFDLRRLDRLTWRSPVRPAKTGG